MRPIRIALPLLLAVTLPACAAGARAGASASIDPAAAQGGLVLQNRMDAVQAMERNYPLLLRDARVTGDVVLAVTVDAQGAVTASSIVSSTQELFGQAAERVAQGLRFSPPAGAGQQVRVRFEFIPDASRISLVR